MEPRFDRVLAASGLRPPLLLAVSGGVDSMVMADLFLHAEDPAFRAFAVAHCNFRLRGADSDADEASVAAWCEAAGIPFFSRSFDTAAVAAETGESVEMAARRLRYDWFTGLCRAQGYTAVAVAHQMDDQLETLFLNLLRGTGLRGLCGLRTVSQPEDSAAGVPVFRPMLSFTREEVLSYAVGHGLSWREDRSNADVRFKRNRIRRDLFPLLEQVNPSFRQTLLKDMERFREVQAVADDAFRAFCTEVSEPPLPGETLRLRTDRLRACAHLPYFLHRLLAPYGFSAAAADALVRTLLSDAPAGKTYYGDDCRLEVSAAHAVLLPDTGPEEAPAPVTVEGPGVYRCGNVAFEVLAEPAPSGPFIPEEGVTVADADRLPFPFVVRAWREGDWMYPLGLRSASGGPGRKKISDLFTDLKYSASEKRRALVVGDGGSHVLALLGSRIDSAVRVRRTTVRTVRLRII